MSEDYLSGDAGDVTHLWRRAKRAVGEATFAAIVDDLAKTFNAPRERIETDVSAMLTGLADKKLMEL